MNAKQPIACPSCGTANHTHDGPTVDATPADGDVSVCWSCRAVALYVETPLGLGLRKPTAAEAEELARDPQLLAALAAASESYTPMDVRELRGWGRS